MRFKSPWLFLLVLPLVFSSTAFAELDVTARAAADIPTSDFSFVSTPAAQLGGEITYGLSDLLQIGATYQHDFLSYKGGGSGSEKFYGAVARMGFYSGSFVDFQAGLCSRDSSSTSFSWGAGLGYSIPMSPLFNLSPRFGYRSLPDSSTTRSMVDFGALLTFRFP